MSSPLPAADCAASITIEELTENPHPILARLRQLAPVVWVPALGGWVVTAHDVAVQVMRDPIRFTVDDPRFSTAQIIGPSMLSLDGHAHQRHRSPFAPAFRPAEIRRRFQAIVAAETDRLLAQLAALDFPDVRRDLAGPLSVAVVAAALGLPDVQPATVLQWYRAIVAGVTAVSAGLPAPPEAGAAFASLRDEIEATLAAADPASLLVAAGRDGLSSTEVVANAAVLMFGGIETTEGMIANAAHFLLHNPASYAEVRADHSKLGAAIEESLRMEPAAANVDRYATEDIALGSAGIRRGDLVIVSLAGANRDPAVFAQPDEFRLDRRNADLQLAFVQGPHFCLGEHLARLEVHSAMDGLLRRFPELRADPDRQASPRGLVFRKPDSVGVVLGRASHA